MIGGHGGDPLRRDIRTLRQGHGEPVAERRSAVAFVIACAGDVFVDEALPRDRAQHGEAVRRQLPVCSGDVEQRATQRDDNALDVGVAQRQHFEEPAEHAVLREIGERGRRDQLFQRWRGHRRY